MRTVKTEIEGVLLLEPTLFRDERGYFLESFLAREFEREVPGVRFVQENESRSTFGVLRGLHLQAGPHAQAKLVRVVLGRVLDVAVDARAGSPTFGRHVARELSGENKLQLFIPRGFAHGYVVLSEEAIVQYKCDAYYAPASERGIRFDDPDVAIRWPLEASRLVLSEKDKKLPSLRELITV
ncbi:MAG: dTDP-4-dehydrorhamnose 3,5-epimerase [Odoribacteraceae bacterium]|jgi:dTDP-4-dehydrorhamnose 3,5-epimerase|nr:dTDP-4-dehydrorhamnose 3,5-epimerase [Odoribacteraceae bacterium]